MNDEQQSQTTTTAAPVTATSACTHPEAMGVRWGDLISEERQAELQRYLANRKRRGSRESEPITITGADLYWLAEQSGRDGANRVPNLRMERADLHGAHLERASLNMAHLQGADLHGAHLEGASLGGAYLDGANLNDAHLEDAYLREVGLRGAHLRGAYLARAELRTWKHPVAPRRHHREHDIRLEGTDLRMANLEKADLSGAQMGHAVLNEANLMGADLSGAHLERAKFFAARMDGVRLAGAHLEGANFREAHLEGADLVGAHLEEAFLREAHLEGAIFGASHTALADARPKRFTIAFGAELEEDDLGMAQLEGVPLGEARTSADDAHLERADLAGAHLERAVLIRAYLEGASLREAHLEGANLINAHLEGTDLRGAWLDSKTALGSAGLDESTKLGDIQWGGVGMINLTQLAWEQVRHLGDEQGVGLRSSASEREAVVRAYRQVAAQLRAQGMSEVADRFLYRAQIRQRGVQLRRGRVLPYLGSWVLAMLTGYGYRPGRTIVVYLAVIATFALLYMQATHGWVPFGLTAPSSLAPLPWYEALILSVSSFHGRGFFQPLQSLGDPIAALAAIEAVIGLLVEVSFIATFTQRFFAR